MKGATHFAYDGSFAGLLCVLARLFAWRETPRSILAGEPSQGDLFAMPVTVATDAARAAAFLFTLEKRLGGGAARRILLAHAAERPESAMAIYRYLTLGRQLGRGFDSHLAHPAVAAVHTLVRPVQREVQRMKGIVRFRRLADGLWYAPIEAECAILPFLAPHFAERMRQESWLIHDVRRQLALFGQGRSWRLEEVAGWLPLAYAEEEICLQGLWRSFFQAVAIPERRNLRLQKHFLPMKYWRHLVEMADA